MESASCELDEKVISASDYESDGSLEYTMDDILDHISDDESEKTLSEAALATTTKPEVSCTGNDDVAVATGDPSGQGQPVSKPEEGDSTIAASGSDVSQQQQQQEVTCNQQQLQQADDISVSDNTSTRKAPNQLLQSCSGNNLASLSESSADPDSVDKTPSCSTGERVSTQSSSQANTDIRGEHCMNDKASTCGANVEDNTYVDNAECESLVVSEDGSETNSESQQPVKPTDSASEIKSAAADISQHDVIAQAEVVVETMMCETTNSIVVEVDKTLDNTEESSKSAVLNNSKLDTGLSTDPTMEPSKPSEEVDSVQDFATDGTAVNKVASASGEQAIKCHGSDAETVDDVMDFLDTQIERGATASEDGDETGTEVVASDVETLASTNDLERPAATVMPDTADLVKDSVMTESCDKQSDVIETTNDVNVTSSSPCCSSERSPGTDDVTDVRVRDAGTFQAPLKGSESEKSCDTTKTVDTPDTEVGDVTDATGAEAAADSANHTADNANATLGDSDTAADSTDAKVDAANATVDNAAAATDTSNSTDVGAASTSVPSGDVTEPNSDSPTAVSSSADDVKPTINDTLTPLSSPTKEAHEELEKSASVSASPADMTASTTSTTTSPTGATTSPASTTASPASTTDTEIPKPDSPTAADETVSTTANIGNDDTTSVAVDSGIAPTGSASGESLDISSGAADDAISDVTHMRDAPGLTSTPKKHLDPKHAESTPVNSTSASETPTPSIGVITPSSSFDTHEPDIYAMEADIVLEVPSMNGNATFSRPRHSGSKKNKPTSVDETSQAADNDDSVADSSLFGHVVDIDISSEATEAATLQLDCRKAKVTDNKASDAVEEYDAVQAPASDAAGESAVVQAPAEVSVSSSEPADTAGQQDSSTVACTDSQDSPTVADKDSQGSPTVADTDIQDSPTVVKEIADTNAAVIILPDQAAAAAAATTCATDATEQVHSDVTVAKANVGDAQTNDQSTTGTAASSVVEQHTANSETDDNTEVSNIADLNANLGHTDSKTYQDVDANHKDETANDSNSNLQNGCVQVRDDNALVKDVENNAIALVQSPSDDGQSTSASMSVSTSSSGENDDNTTPKSDSTTTDDVFTSAQSSLQAPAIDVTPPPEDTSTADTKPCSAGTVPVDDVTEARVPAPEATGGVVMRKKQPTDGLVMSASKTPSRPIVKSTATAEEKALAKEESLQQKVDFEVKMRDGTARLLAASKHPGQLLEAAKNLLTSNTRMITYMAELQHMKFNRAFQAKPSVDTSDGVCKAKLRVSDLRIPLMWSETEYLKHKDNRQFAVFCIVRQGTQIYDTALVTGVNSHKTDITFDDVIDFTDMSHDFELLLEVYSHRVSEHQHVASTPKKLRKKLNSFSTSVGRRLSGLKDDHDANMIVGPKFEKIAEASLKLIDVSASVSTYDLIIHEAQSADKDGHYDLPLFGNVCCRLAAQPDCMMTDVITSQLAVKKQRDTTSMVTHWAVLRNQLLSFYTSPAQHHSNATPELTIPVNRTTRLCEDSEGDVTLVEISNKTARVRSKYLLQGDDNDVTRQWFAALHAHVTNQEHWLHACDMQIDLSASTVPPRASAYVSTYKPAAGVTSSLYSQTEVDSPMTRILNRLNIDLDENDENVMDET